MIRRISALLIAGSLVAFAVPLVTLGAWWNPFSWGKKSEVIITPPVILEEAQEQKPVVGENVIEKSGEKNSQEVLIEYTTDPSLQILVDSLLSQVRSLLAENESLKKEIAEMRLSLNTTTDENEEQSWCSDAKEAYHKMKDKFSSLEREKEEVMSRYVRCGTECNNELLKFKNKENALRLEEGKIKTDITYYCEG